MRQQWFVGLARRVAITSASKGEQSRAAGVLDKLSSPVRP